MNWFCRVKQNEEKIHTGKKEREEIKTILKSNPLVLPDLEQMVSKSVVDELSKNTLKFKGL